MTKLITKEEAVINEVISIIEESKKKVVSYVNTTLLFMYLFIKIIYHLKKKY